MTIPPLSLGIIKGAEWLRALHAEMFTYGQAHGYMNKSAEHTSVHALAGRLQAGPNGNLELTVPSSLIKGVFDALDEPGAEFVVRNNRTESAIKVMTKEEVDKLGGTSHITERGHSYHYTLGPIVELPATGEYEKLWAISIKSDDLEAIRRSYGLETSPQLGFYIPVGCKKKRVTEDNEVSKLAGVYTASGEKVQGVGLRKMYHSLLEEQGLPGLGVNNEDTGDVELSFDGDEVKRQEVFDQLSARVQAKTGHPVTFAPVDIPQSSVPVSLSNKETERLNAIHHLAYRMSNMYDPADPLLDSNDNFKQKLADRFRLQISPRGLKGTVPSRAAEQLLGTRPMYEGMMPARRTRSEEEALSDMAEEQKRRLMKALSGGRGFLAPNESGISKLASLLKSAGETFKYSDKVGVDPEPKREIPEPAPAPAIPKPAPTAPEPSITSTGFSPLKPSNVSTPEFHPGPDYERGDYQRQLQGQPSASKHKPLPEEAPLGNTSMDFSYLAAPFLGKSPSRLWGASNLNAVKAMPAVKYGLPALGATSAVAAAIPGAKTTYDAIARAPQDILDTIYRGAGIPRISKNSRRSSADAGTLLGTRLGSAPRAEDIAIPEIKEVPFSIIGKDNATVSFAKDLGLDVGKQVLSNALHQGLKSYSTSKEGPKGPFGITPSAQISDAAARAAAAAAAEYTDTKGPDYAAAYQKHLNNFLGVDKGETALDTSGLSDPLLSQGNKDRLNTLSAIRRMPLPFELKGNPHFLKEVMDKYTPNLGEAAWDLVFKGRNDAANSAAFNGRLKEIGSTPPHYRDLGKKPTNPVITEQPRLRKEMSEGASRLGKGISDSLIPPRPKGQQPPAMFPQIRKIIEDLGDAAMKTNKEASLLKRAEDNDPTTLEVMPVTKNPSGAIQLGGVIKYPNNDEARASWTHPEAKFRLGNDRSPGADSGPGVFRTHVHGGGGEGEFKLSNPGNIPVYPKMYGDKSHETLNTPRGLLANHNPSTVISGACNGDGGECPTLFNTMFKGLNPPGTKMNLNKVVMTPPGAVAMGSYANTPHQGSVAGPFLEGRSHFMNALKNKFTASDEYDPDPPKNENGDVSSALHEYRLAKGGDPANKAHWTDTGIYTDGRQSMLPGIGIGGEALEMARHLNLSPDVGGGNFTSYLDKVRNITSNPDATYPQKVFSSYARPVGSAAEFGRSFHDIANSVDDNIMLKGMQARSQAQIDEKNRIRAAKPAWTVEDINRMKANAAAKRNNRYGF